MTILLEIIGVGTVVSMFMKIIAALDTPQENRRKRA